MDFTGKTVIITGSGGGIGEGYAKACANKGMNVIIAELNSEAGNRVADEINKDGGKALFIQTDVSDESSAKACADQTVETFGEINFLVNNAAIFGDMKIEGYLNVDMDYLRNSCVSMLMAV